MKNEWGKTKRSPVKPRGLSATLLLAVVFTTVAVPVVFGEALGGKAVPVVEITEKEYDFGLVVDGQEIEHNFIVRNTGPATLEIQKVKTG